MGARARGLVRVRPAERTRDRTGFRASDRPRLRKARDVLQASGEVDGLGAWLGILVEVKVATARDAVHRITPAGQHRRELWGRLRRPVARS